MGESPNRQLSLQPGSNRSSYGGNEIAEAFDVTGHSRPKFRYESFSINNIICCLEEGFLRVSSFSASISSHVSSYYKTFIYGYLCYTCSHVHRNRPEPELPPRHPAA